MRKVLIFTFFLMLLTAVKADNGKGELLVKVSGLHSDNGFVLLAVYSSENGFPDDSAKAVRKAKAAISGKAAFFKIEDLSFGEYAVSILHDENGNMKMDSNFVGIPKEGYGCSNNPDSKFGPPSYEEAKFDFKAPKTIEIKMNYF